MAKPAEGALTHADTKLYKIEKEPGRKKLDGFSIYIRFSIERA